MGVLKKASPAAAQDQNTFQAPPETTNWRLFAMAGSASFASMMFGYDSAFIGSTITLPAFERSFGLDSDKATSLSSHIVSLFQAGCFFGALGVGLINARWGRKWSLIIAALVFIVGAVVQVACDGNLAAMYAGRVLTGLGVGSSSLVVTNYIAECSTPSTRGRLVGGFEMYLQVGLVVGFWVPYGMKLHVPDDGTNKQWIIPFALQLIPPSLLIIAMLFQHESPRWLIEKGRDEKAKKALVWLRNLPEDHPYIDWEMESIRAQIARAENTADGHRLNFSDKLKLAFGKGNRYKLWMGVCLMWLQNLSGINALNYFSNSLVKGIGFTGTSVSLLATGVYGVIKMITTFIFMVFIIDRVGRRKPLLIGLVGAAAALYYLGIYSIVTKSFDASTKVKQDGAAYFALVCIYIFAICYAFSINAIPWIFQSEVFPLTVRSISMAITTANQWLSQFVVVYSAPYMIKSLKGYTFIFFALWTTFAIAFCYILYPETKGISLEQMDILWQGSRYAPRMRKRYDEIIEASRTTGELHDYEAEHRNQGTEQGVDSMEKDEKAIQETV